MSDTVFYLIIAVLFVLFIGEPDLHDALIQYFMTDGASSSSGVSL